MKYQLAVLCTDQVTKAQIRIPASSMMRGTEKHLKASIQAGLFPGTPSHIQHDMHRPIGWMETLGHVIDGATVRLLGLLHEVETDDEKAALGSMAAAYWQHIHHEGMQGYQNELVRRVSPSEISDGIYLRIEAYVVSRPNLAAELYPDLFNDDSSLVDKDGLTDYRALTKRMKQVQPGVFLDGERGLVLFAHRYFRRSLSHKNKLNDYFLKSFETAATDLCSVTPRLRLDPDLIGHSQTVTNLIEQEFWRGPRFTDDISSIPRGVAELKAKNRDKYFEGVDRTQVWWKAPETRRQDDALIEYRTFEIEELIENAAGGLENDGFGCRYAHSEYSSNSGDVTHFDGAIRAYSAEAYLDRIDAAIDHAGKRSDYTKLFRFDGSLPVSRWKRLLCDFFRGNPLVPEYFGATATDERPQEAPLTDEVVDAKPGLSAMIALEPPEALKGWDQTQRFMLEPTEMTLPNGQNVQVFETGCAAVDAFLRNKIEFDDVISIGFPDGQLNLPRMVFASTPEFPQYMTDVVCGLTSALRDDIDNNATQRVAVALAWPQDGLVMTLSLRGSACLVEEALGHLFETVDATKAASEWIERLSQLIKKLAPTPYPTDNLTGVFDRRLLYDHSHDEPVKMLVTDLIVQALSREADSLSTK